MLRAQHSTAKNNVNGAGKKGYTDGDPANGELPTLITTQDVNMIQEEIYNLASISGNSPDPQFRDDCAVYVSSVIFNSYMSHMDDLKAQIGKSLGDNVFGRMNNSVFNVASSPSREGRMTCIAYSPSLFRYVTMKAGDGSTDIKFSRWYSKDLHLSDLTTTTTNSYWTSVAWADFNSSPRFIAVAKSGTQLVASSTNATTWSFLGGYDAKWNSVAFSKSLQLWVAVGSLSSGAGTCNVMYGNSANTISSVLLSTTNLKGVVWSPVDSLFLAVGTPSDGFGDDALFGGLVVYTSSNGSTWSTKTLPLSASSMNPVGVCYSESLSVFAIYGYSSLGSPSVFTTRDGTSYSPVTVRENPNTTGYANVIAMSYSESLRCFCLVTSNLKLLYSSDLVSFAEVTNFQTKFSIESGYTGSCSISAPTQNAEFIIAMNTGNNANTTLVYTKKGQTSSL